MAAPGLEARLLAPETPALRTSHTGESVWLGPRVVFCCSRPHLGLLSPQWLPESARYDVLSGNQEKAIATLKRIATENGAPMPLGKLIISRQVSARRTDLMCCHVSWGACVREKVGVQCTGPARGIWQLQSVYFHCQVLKVPPGAFSQWLEKCPIISPHGSCNYSCFDFIFEHPGSLISRCGCSTIKPH